MKTPNRNAWLDYLLQDVFLRVCAGFTLILAATPPEGFPGLELCLCKRLTNAPCPGCGMTRSGANLFRGNLTRATQYHPFGPVVVPVIIGLGVCAFFPEKWRRAVRRRLTAYGAPLWPLYVLGLTGFALYGVTRWFLVFLGVSAFPATWP